MATKWDVEVVAGDREAPIVATEDTETLKKLSRYFRELRGVGSPENVKITCSKDAQSASGWIEYDAAPTAGDTVTVNGLAITADAAFDAAGDYATTSTASGAANAAAAAIEMYCNPAAENQSVSGTLTFITGAMSVGDAVEIDGVRFVFVTTRTLDNTAAIGADHTESATNLKAAILSVFGDKIRVTQSGAVLTLKKDTGYLQMREIKDTNNYLTVALTEPGGDIARLLWTDVAAASDAVSVDGVTFTFGTGPGLTYVARGSTAIDTVNNFATAVQGYFGSDKISYYKDVTASGGTVPAILALFKTDRCSPIKVIEVTDSTSKLTVAHFNYAVKAKCNYARLTLTDVAADTETVVVNGVTFTAEETAEDTTAVKFLAGVGEVEDVTALAVCLKNYFAESALKVYDWGTGVVEIMSADPDTALTLTHDITNGTHVMRTYIYAAHPGPQGNGFTLAESGTHTVNHAASGTTPTNFVGGKATKSAVIR